MTVHPPLTEVISRDKLNRLLQKSDRLAYQGLFSNWAMILSALCLAGFLPNPLTIGLALLVIAGRQLGLVILMHDCAHDAYFRSKQLNQWVGEWLCGAPMIAQLNGYRSYHLQHHKKAGTKEDPDLANYSAYPVSIASMQRKIIRDLSGRTGLKNLLTVLAMGLGHYEYSLAFRKSKRRRHLPWRQQLRHAYDHLSHPLFVHLILIGLLSALGIAWTYLLWWLSYMTLYQLFLRLRNAAEHAALEQPWSPHPVYHTRTTVARWWERLTVAPNYVNFHIEHHLLPAVPGYRLAGFHRLLQDAQYLPESQVCQGYGEVLRALVKST